MIIASLPKVFIWIDAAVSFISVLGSKRGIAVSNKKPSVIVHKEGGIRDKISWAEFEEIL